VSRVRAFGRFWWDFVVGDDWRVAFFVGVAIALTAILAHSGYDDVWWLLPLAVLAVTTVSLRRAVQRELRHDQPG
jgi:hypothetical protein